MENPKNTEESLFLPPVTDGLEMVSQFGKTPMDSHGPGTQMPEEGTLAARCEEADCVRAEKLPTACSWLGWGYCCCGNEEM